ncbi:diaminopimelate epimerase [Halorussus caseinilyticus]|uniref:diaminopimelate epimerase n=1 Tax=Halorussus caseinilyticus TaxID=3034025 RepID=UPI0023E7A5DD|nr:diaminopimelate epimerase [Halorussus sp. DT72]
MSIEYEKFHGSGNDFVVVDASEYVPDRRAFAREVCDRGDGVSTDGGEATGATRESVGADGTLFLALEDQFSPPRAVMTLVQPDGSTAEMCGNGARCAAKWAAERTGADEIMLDTQAGTRRAEVRDDGVTIEMGEPSFAPGCVPLASDYDEPLVQESVAGIEVTAVNTGVPHAVAFVEDVAEVDLEAVAPEIRHADAFPEGANVTFASPRSEREGDGGFDQRTFERGVEGETRACGTGAVAIAVVARRLGRLDADDVAVFPPGGRLDVSYQGGRATLTGPAEREFEGEVASTPGPRQVREA